MNALQKQVTNTFFQTLEDLKTKENFEIFLNDFLTEKESDSLTKRLAIAYWLKKSRNDENIKTNLKATQKEIDEAKAKLDSKGYKLAIKLMEAEEWANVWSEKINKFRLHRKKLATRHDKLV
ncbi:MAG: Trp family transcriptional regulator [Microgenomates group bacterium]